MEQHTLFILHKGVSTVGKQNINHTNMVACGSLMQGAGAEGAVRERMRVCTMAYQLPAHTRAA